MYWEADLTYAWTGSANAYLFVVLDAWDCDIIGDVFSDRCRAREAGQEERGLSRERYKVEKSTTEIEGA